MKLTELETKLNEKQFECKLVKINNKTIKQDRLYLSIDKNYSIYFIDVDSKIFMNIFVSRPKDFDFSNYKQSDEEKAKCRGAKFKVLNILKNEGIDGLETYANESDVLLYIPKSDTSNKKKFEL
ncbi:hypothetical protein LA345_16080 [Burkholderia vietnamiensis]|uniref:Uncharacterized protein n=1 Tax=Burkholderia vietnamiensis (strain G4 / LMG 22486) TaxID=269482 RepID=A4JHB2_BURVG|nr:hypothetical protein Bcep1808_2673 [Burkholderia vietnamiensis G4]MCB4345422.1 hypothetical protein [Burkholderia vietnamiensis]